MKRTLLGLVACVCALGLAAPIASARIIELGASDAQVTTSCPDGCHVVTRTTALQVNTNGRKYPTTVRRDGRVVAFTLQLGSLTTSQIRYFNRNYGGTPRVQLTVLSQETRRQKKKRFYTASAQSEVFRITPFLGTTAQFPLETTLPVERGDVVALTVSTWAPVLAIDLDRSYSWRASRPGRCRDLLTQTAQLEIDGEAQYKCLYQTAKLQYTATMITSPRPVEREASRRRSSRRTTRSSRAARRARAVKAKRRAARRARAAKAQRRAAARAEAARAGAADGGAQAPAR